MPNRDADDNQADDRPKGLWGVMRQADASQKESAAQSNDAADTDEHGSSTASVEPDDSTEQPPTSPKGLWGVMGDAPDVARAQEEESPHESIGDAASTAVMPVPAAPNAASAAETIHRVAERSRGGFLSLWLGLASLPLAGLVILPAFWLKLPATILGFGALVLGLSALGEIRRSRGRLAGREFAVVGIVLGTVGLFIGPLIFAPIGRNLRHSSSRQQTADRLETIGTALLDFHDRHERFPAGGRFRKDDTGNDQPLHSWMTMTLPYIGQQQLYGQIDLDRPYDDPVNAPAMKTEIFTFHAAGGPRRKDRRGFAITHFAGVGGEILSDETGLAQAGVFGRNSDVRRQDVTDGLSQTLIVGEVAHGFPPWGEPGNWRTAGKGLNRDIGGFGNAEGTGALFLHADGSVRFYSNKVSPDIMRKLSTRNGGERVPDRFQ